MWGPAGGNKKMMETWTDKKWKPFFFQSHARNYILHCWSADWLVSWLVGWFIPCWLWGARNLWQLALFVNKAVHYNTHSLNRPTLDDNMQMRSKELVSCKINLISVMKIWDFLLKILNWVLLQRYYGKPQVSTEDMFRYTKGKLSEKQDINNKTSRIP